MTKSHLLDRVPFLLLCLHFTNNNDTFLSSRTNLPSAMNTDTNMTLKRTLISQLLFPSHSLRPFTSRISTSYTDGNSNKTLFLLPCYFRFSSSLWQSFGKASRDPSNIFYQCKSYPSPLIFHSANGNDFQGN